MWNAMPITADIYGFQQEIGYARSWAATVTIDEKPDRLELTADLFLSELESEDQLERLLDAIRWFSANVKRDIGKPVCLLTVRGAGWTGEALRSLPGTRLTADGLQLASVEFSEEL